MYVQSLSAPPVHQEMTEHIAERLQVMEARVVELERSLQTSLARLDVFERAFGSIMSTSGALTANFIEKVTQCEMNERITVIENVLRGIHQKMSNLAQATSITDSSIALTMERTEKLSCGLQRHGEFCDGLMASTVKRLTDLEKSIAELRSSKLDRSAAQPFVDQAVASLSGQVKKLVALENRRRHEIQGTAQYDVADPPRSKLIGLEIMDLISDGGRECGVKILRVLPDSRSESSGLCAGDVVVKVNGCPVSSRTDFRVAQFPAVLDVLRGENPLTLTIYDS